MLNYIFKYMYYRIFNKNKNKNNIKFRKVVNYFFIRNSYSIHEVDVNGVWKEFKNICITYKWNNYL